MSDVVLRMRREFDESFALPAEVREGERVRLLAIRVGGDPYALPLDGIDGVIADRVIVPVPTTVPVFLGLIGHRGALIPVFDLAAMLGYPRASAPRWTALARNGELPVGIAFEVFEAQLDVRTDKGVRPTHVDGAGPLLSMSSLLAALPRKEMKK